MRSRINSIFLGREKARNATSGPPAGHGSGARAGLPWCGRRRGGHQDLGLFAFQRRLTKSRLLTRLTGTLAQTVAAASPGDLGELAGLDRDFVENELKMLNAMSSGDALFHHLEPAYFKAMTRAVEAAAAAPAPAPAPSPPEGT